jgi:hypothetical protein
VIATATMLVPCRQNILLSPILTRSELPKSLRCNSDFILCEQSTYPSSLTAFPPGALDPKLCAPRVAAQDARMLPNSLAQREKARRR